MKPLTVEPPIDAVITWVDGNDPAHQEKRARYLNCLSKTPKDAENTRFSSVDEIRYCVLSLFRFAPFLRHIYVVTDNQVPSVFEEVRRLYPNRADCLRLVDHTEIFRDYEHLLPTFSSFSIETMLFRIPFLSETFVYFNDDFFLVDDVRPSDWFVNGVPVVRGRWRPTPVVELTLKTTVDLLTRWATFSKMSSVRANYKLGQWRAARLAGFFGKYLWTDHIPRPMRRSVIQEFYSRHPTLAERNASFRIRDVRQYNPQTLAAHLELKRDARFRRDHQSICMKPVDKGNHYVRENLNAAAERMTLFLCIQSLDLANEEDRQTIESWLESYIIEQA